MLRVLLLCLSATILAPAMAAPGNFDARFGSGGLLNLTTATGGAIPASDTAFASTLSVAPDGSVHLGGTLASGLGISSAATFNTRITSDGRLDLAFGQNGLVRRTGYATNGATTDHILVLPTGRLIVSDAFSHGCGFTCPVEPPPAGRRTSALTASGAVDAGFLVDVDFDAKFESAGSAATTYADGTVIQLTRYLSGEFGESPRTRALLPTGLRDVTFERNAASALVCGNQGSLLTRISAAMDSQDRLVVAYGLMKDFSGTRYATCVMRLTRSGQRDASFGVGGIVTFSDDPFSSYSPDGLALTATGAIRISLRYRKADAGSAVVSAGQIRLTVAGTPDTSLAGGATPIFEVPFSSSGHVTQVVPMPDGRSVLAGSLPGANLSSPLRPVIVRMTAAGQPDAGFGQNASGIATLAVDGSQSIVPASLRVLDGDASVLVAGWLRDMQTPLTIRGLVLAKLEGTSTTPEPTPSTGAGNGGGGGGGCGITRQSGAPDPMLPMLALLSLAILGLRGRHR